MTNDPAIVIPCWNRPKLLHRLLKSIIHSGLPGEKRIPLIFSVDSKPPKALIKLIESFEWNFGKKEIVYHSEKKGLRENILFCGDLTNKYGTVILLEEDLIAGRSFYQFAMEAINFYKADERIAGISLYSYDYSELGLNKFIPMNDNSSAFFMKWPSSWGQVWNNKQWMGFRDWYDQNKEEDFATINIHEGINRWPPSSWKKYFCAYLAVSNRYFVYPRQSYTTNPGEQGENYSPGTFRPFQVPLSFLPTGPFSFKEFKDSKVKYDQYFELEFKNIDTEKHYICSRDIEFDLFGNKNLDKISSKYLVSIRKSNNPVCSFRLFEFPAEINIINNNYDGIFTLGLTHSFQPKISLMHKGIIINRQYKFISLGDFFRLLYFKVLKKFRK